MRSGFVGIIGRPNVGKSTLINSLIGTHVAITSDKSGTTRNIIQGIYNDDETQIVFVDTPGIHKPISKLGGLLNKQAYYTVEDVDVLLFLVDVTSKFGKGDEFVIEKLKEAGKPVILILNKIDKIKKHEILEIITTYKDLFAFCEIIPVSALKNDGVEVIIKTLRNHLPDAVAYFPSEVKTSSSEEFMIAEIIREKVLRLTKEEVPHGVTCLVEKIDERANHTHINALIVVDRNSIKKIIVGHQGSMIKEIGTKAKEDIEKLLNKKIYLELFVKVINNWRDKEKYLSEFGFNNFLDK